MSVLAALAATGAATVVLLATPRVVVRRSPAPDPEEGAALLRRWRLPLMALAVVAGWTVVGGVLGVLAGAVAGRIAWGVLGRAEGPAAVRRREQLERDVPIAVHLLGAALVAGSDPVTALSAVAEAVRGPAGEELRIVRHRLALGADPTGVWSSLTGPLAPLGRTMARAHRSGSSVSAAVTALGEDLRTAARQQVEEAARSVEVRAAAPLGACFLPAFVLLGIVPMAAGVFAAIGPLA